MDTNDAWPPTLSRTVHFACDPLATRAARTVVGELVAEAGWAALDVERAQLAVSELAANAVLHARSPFSLSCRYGDGVLQLGVTDHDPSSEPRPRPFDPASVGGMGLHLVADMSRAWGVERTSTRKTVWCQLEPQHARPMASSTGA